MKAFGTVAIVLLLVLSPSIAAAQSPDRVPRDFSVLFSTLRYQGLTALEQQALVGKRYSGELWIYSVEHDNAKGTVRLHCRVPVYNRENELIYLGMASFEMSDAAKAASLKKGYQVRLTGRLARIDKLISDLSDVRGRTEFVDATLDDVIFPPRS